MSRNEIDWDDLHKKAEKLSEDSLLFIFEEAQKYLAASISIADSFKTRAVTALSFLVPTILAIIGYVFATECILITTFPILTGLFILMAASYFCLKVINTKSSYFLGCRPALLLKENWVKDSDQQKKDLLFSQCEEYQKRIDQRVRENNLTGKDFKVVVELMVCSPIVAAFLCVGVGIGLLEPLYSIPTLIFLLLCTVFRDQRASLARRINAICKKL